MKVVVSDTSTVSNLLLIGKLSLLRDIYSQIIIPPAVFNEITALKELGHSIREFHESSWIELSVPETGRINHLLHYQLDRGEMEAIALCQTIQADLLIIDEKHGREVARELGITTTGLLGTLIKAKEKGLIAEVRSIMDELSEKTGFWINPALYREILKICNE